MRTLYFITVLVIIITAAHAQDSLPARVNRIETSVKNLQDSVFKTNVLLASATKNSGDAEVGRKLSSQQKYFVVMPVILFLIIFFVLLIWLNRGGFSLADALKGDVPISVQKPNPALPQAMASATTAALTSPEMIPAQSAMLAAMPATVNVSQTDGNNNPVLPQSSSRFIALFTGFAAIIVAICLLSYYVYFSIAGLPSPNFSQILDAIAGLGIGVVPYAVTKLTQK